MISPFLISSSLPEQYAEIADLVAAVYVREGYTDAEAGRRMFVPAELCRRGDILVATGGGREIIGTVILAEPSNPLRQIAREGEAEVQLLTVHPRFRANGIGTILMRACHERALAKGYSRIVLSTQPTMRAAHRLYERLGYQRNASRDWQARGRQFLAYEKSLTLEEPA